MTTTLEAIRAAGGIVHSDGNIFFRDISMLQGLAGAAPAAATGTVEHHSAVLVAARDLISLRTEYAQKTQNAMPGNEYWGTRFDAKYQALAAALAAAPALEAPAAPTPVGEAGTKLYTQPMAAAPQAPAAPAEPVTQVIDSLLSMARIVNVAVEDWGETKEDDTLHVIFHKEQADKLEEILDFLDSLPDAPPEEGVILSGPSRAARVLRAMAAPAAPTPGMTPRDRETQDQIASVMLQHGTAEQQSQALAYASGATPAAPVLQLASARAGRIYVAGPMTGMPDHNFPAFNAAAADLRAKGWHVENPAEHGVVVGAEWADYLHYDMGRLATCEAIHLLPGWCQSRGAALEVHVASVLGMKFQYAEGAEIYHPPTAASAAPVVNPSATWTSSDDGLPEHGDLVLCNFGPGYHGGGGVRFGYEVLKWDEHHVVADVSRWMKLDRLPAAHAAPADPMDWPLPCDVTVGHGTIRKGCKLRTLVLRMQVLYNLAQETELAAPAAPAVDADHRWGCRANAGGACDKACVSKAAPAVDAPPLDVCTDPYNCARCKTHPAHRGDMHHAGISLPRSAAQAKEGGEA